MFKKILLPLVLVIILLAGGLVYYLWTMGEEEFIDTTEPLSVPIVEEKMGEEEATDVETAPVLESDSWKPIADSFTEYLIWGGEFVAMVEQCPAGYFELYDGFYVCEDTDSAWLEFEFLDGTAVRVPGEAGMWFLLDRGNPGGSAFQDTMTADEKYWIYLDTWSDDEARVMAYNVTTATDEILMSFLPLDEASYCGGIRFFGWNPSQTKLGIVVGNEGADDTYPTDTRVFILTIVDGKLTNKSKYDLRVLADCSANNGPFFVVDWIDDDTLGYYNPEDNPYGDYTRDDYDPEYLETLFWSDDPWGSEYARYYDVN